MSDDDHAGVRAQVTVALSLDARLREAHDPDPAPGGLPVFSTRRLGSCDHDIGMVVQVSHQAPRLPPYCTRFLLDWRIAAEEARHASLAWQIDAWARRRLAPAARARVDRARDEAVRELLSGVTQPVPEALGRTLGLPDQPIAAQLARRIIAALGLA